MRSTPAVVVLTVVLAAGLAAQGPRASEFDVGALATWARRSFQGVSLGLARRPGGQGRLAAVVAAGPAGGRLAFRAEATAQFLITPAARRGATPYGGLGVGYLGGRGLRGTGVLVVLLGIEAAAGRSHGWFAEVGLGGGARVRLGYRWRALPPWYP